MIIIPAIDLKDGMCVQLVQGRMEDATVFGTDPAEMARRWMDEGARWLHVVDLDGAFAGVSRNIDAIRAIRKAVRIPVELGGGIRTMDAAVRMLDEIGLDRIVLGTAALRDSELVAQVVKRYTDRIAVGIDARSGHVAVSGWAEDTEVSAIALALRMRDMGVKTL
ncbi:MAG: 1-(5-phosphoribosyl)-5-((5-phosphoribosylamino)methylideneamino)imidazole-4-carboxamide isomerase, partial [Clostridiales bacterium]|nr:1-(5-phosphoribosyl)-5-((5-phosphoribosylamino)methylideneamino)imidazole-4-carboxamide isomerase [Clostridiales bacterium]